MSWFRLVVSPSTVQTPSRRFLEGVDAEIVAAHLLVADQLCQLIARGCDRRSKRQRARRCTSGRRRRLDAIEARGRAGELHIAAIPDGCARGRTLAGRKYDR